MASFLPQAHRRPCTSAAVLTLLASSAICEAATPLRESFDLQTPFAPAPTRVQGSPQLRYELHLTNFSARTLQPTSLRILDAGDGLTLATLQGDALNILRSTPAAGSRADAPIAPGMRGLIYIDLTLAPDSLPVALTHQIDYAAIDDAAAGSSTFAAAPIALDPRPVVRLGPPLRGGPWAAIHHPDWPRGHRRVLYTLDGRARIPGRHAIDWVRLDDQGRSAASDPDIVANAYGHGAEVLAVADAVVAATRDDMDESVRVSTHAKQALGDGSGNYVVLDLGQQRFAFYEHLQPRSVRVKPGQRVRRGDPVGALGFSGDTTGPHLHFHVADAASTLAAEGVPFVFEHFTLLGRYDDIGALGTQRWQPLAADVAPQRRHEAPAPNVVVAFD